jgi:hypothetical protein
MMSHLRTALAAAAAALPVALAPVPALADAIAPIVSLTLDGAPIGDIQPVLDTTTGNWVVENYYWSGSEGQIILNAELDPDPQIVYAAAVIDFGAPSVFGFVFGLPIVPTPAPGIVTHSESSSTTDAGGVAGTPVTALPPIGIPVDGDLVTEQFVYTLSQNGGALLLNAGLDIRGSFVGASPSDTQAAINLGPIAGPAGAGFYDFMRIDVNFSMTGGSDAYTFNGIATVVPEPATAVLFGLGLGGLALFGRRRSR